MQIAVLASGDIREEWLARPIPDSFTVCWAESLDGLLGLTAADAWFDLDFVFASKRVEALSRLLPGPVFVNSVVHTLAEIGQPFIRINAWPTFLRRNILELVVLPARRETAETILQALSWEREYSPDTPGMISPRIVSMLINEAYYTMEQGVSSREDIDTAMKLGTNYPFGPFDWSKKIGLSKIHDLLSRLAESGSRYTISKALEQEYHTTCASS